MPRRNDIHKVLVIGSGPIVIGQAAEFDYAGTQACLALKEEGLQVVLVNSNPATIMTDESVADQVYIEPLTTRSLRKIIAKERPDGMIGTLGGQTGLNLAVKLHQEGVLSEFGVELLGSSVEAIQKGEDRELFRSLMQEIGEPIPESEIVTSVESGLQFVRKIGFPVIIRPAYTLGGAGGGFAFNEEELELLLTKGLRASPIQQVLVERSIKGWKEIEYEVMRDANDTCIIVCNMENMDPVGVHTGDSIVIAPSQTLTDVQYQMLRNASLKVIRALDVVGGCNIQFALDPHSEKYCIIEVNPRVSRSSALASKATGYPIARMAAKCALGYHLDELLNPVTGYTYASFEPALDYVVVKLPRFPFDKFIEADRLLGTQMKATGEVMAIDRTFEGALNKGLRSMELKVNSLHLRRAEVSSDEELRYDLQQPSDTRLFSIAEALRRGMSIDAIQQLTEIDPWFLNKINKIVILEQELQQYEWTHVPRQLLYKAKRMHIADAFLAQIFSVSESHIRERWQQWDWKPGYKLVDTCAAEFDAETPYYYSTWCGEDEADVSSDRKKIIVIGSGPIRIGQGIEFDYCSVHAAQAVQDKGYEVIVMNNNPETVSTDYSVADKLYFEPLTAEDILHVVAKEQAEGVLIQFGGQTAINVAQQLEDAGVTVLGTSLTAVDALEDRHSFYDLLKKLDIPHIAGQMVHAPHELHEAAALLGFPVLVRPSYVIGGQFMFIFYGAAELHDYVRQLEQNPDERMWPLLVDSYVAGMECEIDVLSDGQDILIPGVFEHIEKAGVHSGDSTTIFPPVTLKPDIQDVLVDYARKIAQEAHVIGIMNIQFVVQNDTVYVLEVNPRASRTVPIISKVTGIPMIKWATFIQLGAKLSEVHEGTGLLPEPDFYAVKAPIFSNVKLNDVDDALGPEMKSTGEVLGLGKTVEEALYKALFAGQSNPLLAPHGATYPEHAAQADCLICSFADRDKAAALPFVQQLTVNAAGLRLQVLATPGTAAFLAKHGLPITQTIHSLEQAEPFFKAGRVKGVLNTANQGRVKGRLGFQLRMLARKYQVPCYTRLETLGAVLSLPAELDWDVTTIYAYRHQLQTKK